MSTANFIIVTYLSSSSKPLNASHNAIVSNCATLLMIIKPSLLTSQSASYATWRGKWASSNGTIFHLCRATAFLFIACSLVVYKCVWLLFSVYKFLRASINIWLGVFRGFCFVFSPLVSCDVEIYEHVGIWEHLQLDSMLCYRRKFFGRCCCFKLMQTNNFSGEFNCCIKVIFVRSDLQTKICELATICCVGGVRTEMFTVEPR